jgi:N-formylmaleamate deformylase
MAALDVLTPPNPAYRELVRKIDVRSLLIIGDSPVVTFEMATELRSLNPRVQIEQIERAGHGLPFEQPERVVVPTKLRRCATTRVIGLLCLDWVQSGREMHLERVRARSALDGC